MFREKIKKVAVRHEKLLSIYRATFGKIKTSIYFNMQKKALQKNGYDIIQRVDRVMREAKITYFLDFGTLLGICREGKLIAHDRDMDFGIYFDNGFGETELDQMMKQIGMKKERSFVFRGQPKEISYFNGITNIDFFVHEEVEDKSIAYVFSRKLEKKYPSDKHYSVMELSHAHITGVKRIAVNGFEMNIPENYEEYLKSAYTSNWKIPDPKWTYLSDPGLKEISGEFAIKM